MRYVHYNDTKVLGFYDPDIHNNIPEPNFAISDEVWMAFLSDQRSYEVQGGMLVYAPHVPTAEETQAEQMTALEAEFVPRRKALWDYLSLAVNYWQNEDFAASIRTELDALEAEYNKRAGEILNGD